MAEGDVDLREHARGAPERDDRSLGELFGELNREFGHLVRQEVQLAKTELREEAAKAGKAAGMLGGAGVAAMFALLLLSFAAAWGLAEVMPAGFAFLIVGAVYAVLSLILFLRGRAQLKEVSPVPEQTIDTLKEDVQWAKAPMK